MKSKKWFYIAIVLLVINVMTLAKLWLPRFEGRSKADHQNREGYMEGKLDLTDEQKALMKSLRSNHFQEVRRLKKSLFQARKSVFKKSKVDASVSEISNELSEIGNIQKQIDSMTFVHFSKLRAVCTDEQQEAFNELLADLIKRGIDAKMPSPRGQRKGDNDDHPPFRP